MRHRVLMLPAWYPSTRYPGETAWAQEIARAIATRHEVRVLAYRMSPAPEQRNLSLVETDEGGIEALRARYPGMTGRGLPPVQIAAAMAGARQLRREGFAPDVIHAHVYIAGLAGLALKRQLGVPLVVTEHYSEVRREELGRLRSALANRVYRDADLLTAPSADLAEHVSARSGRSVEVVPNAVDTVIFHPPDEGGGQALEQPARLLAVGRLHPVKGLGYLLDALAELRTTRGIRPGLRVVGDGAERSALERQARSLGIAEQVELIGPLDRHRVAEEMRAADLFVQPSLHENAPVSLSEALACGLPAVATDVGGVGEMLDPGSGVVVPPADAGAFAGGIEQTLERSAELSGARIAKQAAGRYGFDAVARRWGEIYESVVCGSGGRFPGQMPKP